MIAGILKEDEAERCQGLYSARRVSWRERVLTFEIFTVPIAVAVPTSRDIVAVRKEDEVSTGGQVDTDDRTNIGESKGI